MKSCCHASSLETQKESVQECSPDLPSTPPFGYILGPDSPSVDEPCRGTLRLSGQQIHTAVFVTQADILTSALSPRIFMDASLRAERSPTVFYICKILTASAEYLVPVIFGARALDQ